MSARNLGLHLYGPDVVPHGEAGEWDLVLEQAVVDDDGKNQRRELSHLLHITSRDPMAVGYIFSSLERGMGMPTRQHFESWTHGDDPWKPVAG